MMSPPSLILILAIILLEKIETSQTEGWQPRTHLSGLAMWVGEEVFLVALRPLRSQLQKRPALFQEDLTVRVAKT